MTQSEKLDKVLQELQEVRRELTEVKQNQPMFFTAGEPAVTLTAQGGNTCSACGAIHSAVFDLGNTLSSPTVWIDQPMTAAPSTTVTFDPSYKAPGA